jgi:hypothetical protein
MGGYVRIFIVVQVSVLFKIFRYLMQLVTVVGQVRHWLKTLIRGRQLIILKKGAAWVTRGRN